MWIRVIRFPLKLLFVFLGKAKWHNFEKRFINYWSCNICGQSSLSYFDIIKNNKGARHYVSWYTLISEKILLGENWQKIEVDKNFK